MKNDELSEGVLHEIMQRHRATTGGEWRSFIEGRDHCSGSNFIQTDRNDIELTGATEADQDFIAAAHQDIPKLVAELRRLKGWSP